MTQTAPNIVRTEDMARLEAILFLAKQPLSLRKLSQLVEVADGTQVRQWIQELNHRYDIQPCAFHIVEVAGGYQLRTRPQFAPWLARLHPQPAELRLSGAALETLAVIAFRQPVLRAEVESVRGVQCGEIIRQLMDIDLVRITGRSDELGRPFFYGTTPKFLLTFGLRQISDLTHQTTTHER